MFILTRYLPKSVQQAIPIRAIWPDGIFAVSNKFSKSFRFADINYAVASREDKETMFLSYSELLNSFDSGATTKITIHNRRLNQADVERSILIPLQALQNRTRHPKNEAVHERSSVALFLALELTSP
jgi:hypothetical protein